MNTFISGYSSENSKYFITPTPQKIPAKENPTSPLRKAAAITAGTALALSPTAYLANEYLKKVSFENLPVYKNIMLNILPNLDSLEQTKSNIENILEETGLKEKGVKLFVATEKKQEELSNILSKDIKGNSYISKALRESFVQKITEGLNACFAPATKHIIIPETQSYVSAYHEAGHAYNATFSKIGKILQKARNLTPYGVPLIMPLLLAVGLSHDVKNTPKNEKSKFEKVKDFIKNNAGKLTLVSFIPMLAEEGLASINGLKFAKKYMQPDKLKILGRSYAIAWLSYASIAALFTTSTWGGIKIKDKIMNYKKNA